MRDPVSNFIDLVGTHFPRPKFPSEDAEAVWAASWVRLLGQYDPGVLAKAADNIIRTRDRKKDGAFFPVPKEVIQACEDAKRALLLKQLPMLPGSVEPTGFNPDRHKLALDLLGTELGIEAVKARWHGALYDFVYRNARMPKGTEIAAVKRASQAFYEAVEACERGELGQLSPSLAKLGRGIAKRREDYARSIE